ncbi:MAG: hypothetical protein RJQ00_06530 [Vicingaceae bacterium]
MFESRYQFYNQIVNGNTPVRDIFSQLSSLTPLEYDELYNEFSVRVDQRFNSSKVTHINETKTFKHNYPNRIRTRVRLAIILLSVCALGTTFDEKVYSYTLDFVLKKELCLIPLSLN